MTTPIGLELVWADAGGTADPGNAKYQLGWVAEIPTFQNFNHVLHALDRAKLSYAENDIYPWQNKIAYKAGARVERGGKTFYCKTPHNNSAGSNPQDPLLDTTNSYWVNGTVFSSQADAFTSLDGKDGVLIDRINPRTDSGLWQGNDLTLNNAAPFLMLGTNGAYDNHLLANVRGEVVLMNVGNLSQADGRSALPSAANQSYRLFHEGHAPTQSEVSGTIPDSPTDGKLYARQAGNWVEVTSTTVGSTPPAAAVGAGRGWFNTEDAQFYIDIFDGDTSQWIPANPPVMPDLAPIKQRVSDVSNAFVGMESYFPPIAGSGVHPAWIEKAGGLFSRTSYASLFSWADAHGLVTSEAHWQAIKADSPNGSVSMYSYGDGTTTFRVPDIGEAGGFARALKGPTGGSTPLGNAYSGFEDQLQNIIGQTTGADTSKDSGAVTSGAFEVRGYSNTGRGTNLDPTGVYEMVVGFDASRVARTGAETSPRGMYQRVYIYTGNIVEDLPTPTPSWLAQQDVNTNNLTNYASIINRQWHNMAGSRNPSVTYTNPNTYPIMLLISATEGGSGANVLTIDGLIMHADGDSGNVQPFVAEVPPGGTYSMAISSSGSIARWHEMY